MRENSARHTRLKFQPAFIWAGWNIFLEYFHVNDKNIATQDDFSNKFLKSNG